MSSRASAAGSRGGSGPGPRTDPDLDIYLPLRDAFAEVGIRPHISTLIRWTRGRATGALDARRVGGRWFCTRSAVQRFIGAGDRTSSVQPLGLEPPSPDRVDAALAALGM